MTSNLTNKIANKKLSAKKNKKRLKYFKGIAQYALVYKAKNVDEENFFKNLNGKCDEKHPDIFDMSFLFEKDMREFTLKVLPLFKEGIKVARD